MSRRGNKTNNNLKAARRKEGRSCGGDVWKPFFISFIFSLFQDYDFSPFSFMSLIPFSLSIYFFDHIFSLAGALKYV